jgi:cytosine/uracil/thiamine/allantoin permease
MRSRPRYRRPGRKPPRQFARQEKDTKLLKGEHWLARNGHTLTFVGLYLFSVLVLYRPYELVPALGFLASTAFYFALATLAIYLPTQFATEGQRHDAFDGRQSGSSRWRSLHS